MNIRRYRVLVVWIIIAGSILTHNTLSYGNEGTNGSYGPWGVGLRIGPAIATQDLRTAGGGSLNGDVGPVIEGEVQYDFTDSFSAGFGLEWENHGVNASVLGVDVDVGSIDTVSLMPFARYRFNLEHFHPYFNLGAGLNINSFSIASTIVGTSTAGVATSLNNSFAIKPGVGIDYFVTDSLALNAEFDWKWNFANLTTSIPSVGVTGTVGLNMSPIQLLFGARYYF